MSGLVPSARAVRVMEPVNRCVVIGSTQSDVVLDRSRLAAAGIQAARRRSGGSAVMVGPCDLVWVDVVVPAVDPLWLADVGRAGWWLGDQWANALAASGCPGAQVWRGSLVRTAWSDRVCFAGLGPGEVTVRGRKVLGVSQRRTRAGALFQCALLVEWAPAELLDVLHLDEEDRAQGGRDLAGVAAGVGAEGAAAALEAFIAGLGRRDRDRAGSSRVRDLPSTR